MVDARVSQEITELDISGNGFGAADGTMIFGNVEKYHYMGLQWNFSVRRLNVRRHLSQAESDPCPKT